MSSCLSCLPRCSLSYVPPGGMARLAVSQPRTASARAMGRSDLGPGVILKYLEYVFVKRTLR